MKEYLFPYSIATGKLDVTSSSVLCSLSDEDSNRLERSAKEGGRFCLDEDDEIYDIFHKVLNAVYKTEMEGLIADPESIGSKRDSKLASLKRQAKRYLDALDIKIYYPEELQGLERSTPKKATQSACEIVVVERFDPRDYHFMQQFLKEHADHIVCTDMGKTLCFVPSCYSGQLIVPETVRSFAHKVFSNHEKITEIIIEPGLEEIPDYAFEGCKGVEHISIPPTVRRIGANAFSGCEVLVQVDLSEGIEEIENTAFRFCHSLKELRLPASLKSLNAWICSYYNGIKEIHFCGSETEIEDSRGGDLSAVTFYVKRGSKAERYAVKHRLKRIIEE